MLKINKYLKYMTPEFDKFCEGLWDNINKAKKKGKVSSKWKNDPKYRKQMKKQAAKISKEDLDEAKCTKTTKKASSTSKGKKWMKCVKNPDGKGYKRIHWGQKGVKVSGKANTKRRKSFRARHKCSSAKPGTPRYQACKDW